MKIVVAILVLNKTFSFQILSRIHKPVEITLIIKAKIIFEYICEILLYVTFLIPTFSIQILCWIPKRISHLYEEVS